MTARSPPDWRVADSRCSFSSSRNLTWMSMLYLRNAAHPLSGLTFMASGLGGQAIEPDKCRQLRRLRAADPDRDADRAPVERRAAVEAGLAPARQAHLRTPSQATSLLTGALLLVHTPLLTSRIPVAIVLVQPEHSWHEEVYWRRILKLASHTRRSSSTQVTL